MENEDDPTKTEHYYKGYDACYEEGRKITECPHYPEDWMRDMWRWGWSDANRGWEDRIYNV